MSFFLRAPATIGPVLGQAEVASFSFIENIEFDLSAGEDYTSRVRWTTHPAEDGADITDNGVRELDTVILQGVVTQTPIATPARPPAPGAPPADLIARADATLLRMVRNREPVAVITGLRSLEQYVITEYRVTRSPSDGQVHRFTLALQEFIFVSPEEVIIPPAPVKKDKKTATKKRIDCGPREGEPKDPDAEVGGTEEGTKGPSVDNGEGGEGSDDGSSATEDGVAEKTDQQQQEEAEEDVETLASKAYKEGKASARRLTGEED